jgi:ankyrin repeat protein
MNQQDDKGLTPLNTACLHDHTNIVELLLDYGADPTIQNNNGSNILHIACEKENWELARKLVQELLSTSDQNILMNRQVDNKGFIPLNLACFMGYIDMIKLLIENGTNTEILNEKDENILYLACKGRHPEVVQYLLTLDNIRTPTFMEQKNIWGQTPLSTTCSRGHTDIIELLIENGTNTVILNENNENILYLACNGIHPEAVQYLLTLDNIRTPEFMEQKNIWGQTPLSSACSRGHIDIIKSLIENGANTETLNKNNENILSLACKGRHLEVVQYLLTLDNIRTPDFMEQRSIWGQTALSAACSRGHTNIIELLIGNGADITIQYKNGSSVLHRVCMAREEKIHIVRNLLSIFKDTSIMEQKNNNGLTPLNLACFHGHTKIAKLFLENGADFTVQYNDGSNILHMLCKNGNYNLVHHILPVFKHHTSLIKQQDTLGHTPLSLACLHGHTKIVESFLEKDLCPTVQCNDGSNLLHLACISGEIEIVEHLLNFYPKLMEQQNNDGSTPLCAACAKGNMDIIKSLVENGSDTRTVNGNGENILYLACLNGHLDVVQYLFTLDKLCDSKFMKQKNSKKRTALDAAHSNNHTKIAKLLTEHDVHDK